MKKLLLLLAVVVTTACSSDDNDCVGSRAEINERYDAMIQHIIDNSLPGGPDQAQINLVNQERQLKLAQACD